MTPCWHQCWRLPGRTAQQNKSSSTAQGTRSAEPSKGGLVRLPAGIQEKEGDVGSWGRDKLFQPPPPHWNPQLALVPERLQHWNTSVSKSVNYLAQKTLVRTEEWANPKLWLSTSPKQDEVTTAWENSPSAPKDSRSKTAIYTTHLYRPYLWAASCLEVPTGLKCMRF